MGRNTRKETRLTIKYPNAPLPDTPILWAQKQPTRLNMQSRAPIRPTDAATDGIIGYRIAEERRRAEPHYTPGCQKPWNNSDPEIEDDAKCAEDTGIRGRKPRNLQGLVWICLISGVYLDISYICKACSNGQQPRRSSGAQRKRTNQSHIMASDRGTATLCNQWSAKCESEANIDECVNPNRIHHGTKTAATTHA